ncbi:MAG: alpha/beta fold hydrolase [Pseudomonadota bacterium]
MSPPVKTYIDGSFGQIHVRRAKATKETARPIFLLHQSPKSSLSFNRFIPAMSLERDVVAPDYPGYGMSDPPPTAHEATIKLYAEECWRVADALGYTKPIDLFGHHTGAKVAVEMAHQQPSRVNQVVMVSAAIFTPTEQAEFRDYFTPIPLDHAGTRFTEMWRRIHHHAGPGMTLEMKASALLENLMGGDAYEWGHKAAFDYGSTFAKRLASLAHRITIINVGDELAEATRRAAPLLNNGEIIERPEWGHGMFDTVPLEIAELVTRILNKKDFEPK